MSNLAKLPQINLSLTESTLTGQITADQISADIDSVDMIQSKFTDLKFTNSISANSMFIYLQFEYKRYSKLISNMIIHIESLHNNSIIHNNERIQSIKMLNDIIKELNDIYNVKRHKIHNNSINKNFINNIVNSETNTISDDDSDSSSESGQGIIIKSESVSSTRNGPEFGTNITDNKNKYSDTQIIEMLNVHKIMGINVYNKYFIDDFNGIRKKLLKIGRLHGFYNLDDAMEMMAGYKYELLLGSTSTHAVEIFNVILDIFIPLSYTIENNTNTTYKNEPFVISRLTTCDNEIILENYAELRIKLNNSNKIYLFEGYYLHEPTNSVMRTSQICNNIVYIKKKELEDYVSGVKYITEKFKSNYIKNMTIGEVVSCDRMSFIEKIENDYKKFNNYSKMNFKNLMAEFNKDTVQYLKNMHNIIKLLLMGSDDCINIAGMLFGLTKDKKVGNSIIADIIYRNMCYVSQTKLRKSTITLKAELDKLKSLISDDVDLKKQIALSRNMPNNVKKIALEKIEEMKSGSSEYYKQLTYVNILVNYPWTNDKHTNDKCTNDKCTNDKCTNDKNGKIDNDDDIFSNIGKDINKSHEFLERTKRVLDENVYGHDECKATMQELIGKWITNPNSIGKAIGLVGPPGVGKTLIAKGLGDALGIPFAQINLGGIEDGCVLNGHSYTYSAAQPGMIVRKMVETGKSRCVIFFDELDKACSKHGVNEIFNVLVHATDTNTNNAFNDKFFQEVTFPINKVLFVFSYNDSSKIDKILLDRMEKIEVKPYTVSDKITITTDFLLKEISSGIGLEYGSITIDKENIENIIESYTFEAGVRELKRKLETLFLKLNLDRLYKRGIFEKQENFSKNEPIVLSSDVINGYLNKPTNNVKLIHKHPSIGIINGLYATTNGSGGIIPILVYGNHIGVKNKFTLKLTGSQGKVMKESVSFALTIALSLVKKEYRDKFLEKYPFGLHVHTPDGATPKDGPSAGCAFTTAFISIILGKKIKNNIALTGEIEMNGNISEIGGLVYKLAGAKKAGITNVFIPKENEHDFEKIKKNDPKLLENFDVKVVSHIREVLDGALIDDNHVFHSMNYLDTYPNE